MSDKPSIIVPKPATISPEAMEARLALRAKYGRPSWALKSGTVVVTTTLNSPLGQPAEGK